MSLRETLKREIRLTSEALKTPQIALKQKARSFVEVINLSAKFRLDSGVITQAELDGLSEDPNQETLYKGIMKAFNRHPDSLSIALGDLSLAQQTDLGLRHAKWLTQHFDLEN